MTDISAPIFDFRESHELTARDAYIRAMPEGLLSLSGPSVTAEAGHLPVRGDLAHIRLAGRYFVPHYAVPMPHTILDSGAALRKAAKADAEQVETLAAGGTFDVLDISGAWAWGQFGEDGPVGYVLLTHLEAQ